LLLGALSWSQRYRLAILKVTVRLSRVRVRVTDSVKVSSAIQNGEPSELWLGIVSVSELLGIVEV